MTGFIGTKDAVPSAGTLRTCAPASNGLKCFEDRDWCWCVVSDQVELLCSLFATVCLPS